MVAADFRKRSVPKPEANSNRDLPSFAKASSQTITWREISDWQFDNRFILNGYRPAGDCIEVFRSLKFMHNETCNVYTHLVPALVLPFAVPIFLYGLGGRSRPLLLDVTPMDRAMFGVFFCCAEFCLVSSALYHLMRSHSHRVELFWHGIDLLGIVIVTVGTFSSGIYYVFFCEGNLQKLHWSIVSSSKQSCFLFCVVPRTREHMLTGCEL